MANRKGRLYALIAALSPVCVSAQTPAPVAPGVEVIFVQPEKFRDVGARYRGDSASRADYLKELDRFVRSRAASLLPADRRLVVRITDVDMAGEFEPWRGSLGATRIVRDVYPPRIDLTFTLADERGTVIASGERKLRDPALVGRPQQSAGDPLRYEKALLDDWLVRELGTAATAAR
jgi:hypothetical protein